MSKRVRGADQDGRHISFNLILQKVSQYLCYLLVVRNQSLSPAHTQEERYTSAWLLGGRDHGGHFRGCLLQTGKLTGVNSSVSLLSESNSCSQDSQYSFFTGSLSRISQFLHFSSGTVFLERFLSICSLKPLAVPKMRLGLSSHT